MVLKSSLPIVEPKLRRRPVTKLRWNAWNLLLFVPLFFLFTPLYNRIEPRVLGMPFFYWFQLAFLLVGALVTTLVHLMTRDEYVVTDQPDLLTVDLSDEEAWR